MSRRQKQALRRAPKEERAIERTLYCNQELSSFRKEQRSWLYLSDQSPVYMEKTCPE